MKRRLLARDDSSDEEGDEMGTGSFLMLSGDEATKDSEKVKLKTRQLLVLWEK